MNNTIITIGLGSIQVIWDKIKTTAIYAIIAAGLYAWYIHYRYKRIEDKINYLIKNEQDQKDNIVDVFGSDYGFHITKNLYPCF